MYYRQLFSLKNSTAGDAIKIVPHQRATHVQLLQRRLHQNRRLPSSKSRGASLRYAMGGACRNQEILIGLEVKRTAYRQLRLQARSRSRFPLPFGEACEHRRDPEEALSA
jgi:hypothetical protein